MTSSIQWNTDSLLKILDWWCTQCRSWHELHTQGRVLLASVTNIQSQRSHTHMCSTAWTQVEPALAQNTESLIQTDHLQTLMVHQTREIVTALSRLRDLVSQMGTLVQDMGKRCQQLSGVVRQLLISEATEPLGDVPGLLSTSSACSHSTGQRMLRPAQLLHLIQQLYDMHHAEWQAQCRLCLQLDPVAIADAGDSALKNPLAALTQRWADKSCMDSTVELSLEEWLKVLKKLKRTLAVA
ncbi:hypothetical protein IWQ62_003209 [Dispira parvispora]|uniref:Uncharacterized protein n=1 Tax=Dispira parvispora TaxID=1520584 RepID=A0A9W8AP32_9FUNG|nr:hypothetical protein IWQ62_003209 [Dispira parvispora]